MAKRKYPVITLCGSTKFKNEFEAIQRKLTLEGNIVISVGLFGHAGDSEVWEEKSEDDVTNTKLMLDDMHKSKIDLADSIFVVNPGGYIGYSTWSEICYARMTGKKIESLEPIHPAEIEIKIRQHIRVAKALAERQYDVWCHTVSDYPGDSLIESMVTVEKDGIATMDPWIQKDGPIEAADYLTISHYDADSGYNPFKVYGKKNMARFVEDIILQTRNENIISIIEEDKERICKEMVHEIDEYCKLYNLEYPKGYPDQMTFEEMQDWICCWSEFDPYPDLK